MKSTFIYALCDPRTFEVRYVGKSDNPYKRYCEHLIDKTSSYKVRWIKQLLNNGFNPILQILEQCDDSVWQQREKDWIAFEKRIGCRLTNETIGGDACFEGKHHSEKTKRILSEKTSQIMKGHAPWLRGRKASEETKRKQSLAMKGRSNYWLKGKHLSENHKRKVSDALKGKTTWNKGKHHSEETKKKMSLAHSSNKNPLFGKHISEKVRLKMSKAKQGYIPWNKGLTGL